MNAMKKTETLGSLSVLMQEPHWFKNY